ncbi:MAG: transglycosylase SLT domain-containing protein [Candidatus Micrarchaeia archaeon]|jgi:hypothetical protein
MLIFQALSSARRQGKQDLRQFSDVPRGVFSDALKAGASPFIFTYLNMKDETHQRLVFGKENKYFDYRFGKKDVGSPKAWVDGEDAWVAKAGVKKLLLKRELGRTEIKFITGKIVLELVPVKSIGLEGAKQGGQADKAQAGLMAEEGAPAKGARMERIAGNAAPVKEEETQGGLADGERVEEGGMPAPENAGIALLKATPAKANGTAMDDASVRLWELLKEEQRYDTTDNKVVPYMQRKREIGFTGLFNRLRQEKNGKMLLEVAASRCKEKGVPLESALAVVCFESYAVNGVKSYAGAYGYAQVKPGTAKMMKVEFKSAAHLRVDADTNIRAGVAYLAHLYEKFGSWPEAYSAYNNGEHAQVNVNSRYVRGVLSFERFLKEAKVERLLEMGTREFMETPEYKSAVANLEAQQYAYLDLKR